MRPLRSIAFLVTAGASLLACTFVRSLDYLQAGAPDAGANIEPVIEGGTSSSSGGVDAGPATVLIGNQSSPTSLRQDADSVYFENDSGEVYRVPKAGGDSQLLGKVAGSGLDLAVDPALDGLVYALTDEGIFTFPKTAKSAPPTPWLASTTGTYIAADSDFVFVLNTLADANSSSMLTRYPKGSPTTATNLSPAKETAPTALVLAGTRVYWAVTNAANELVVNEIEKGAPNNQGMVVYYNTVKLQGSVEEDEIDGSSALAADADGVFWVDTSESIAYHLPRTKPRAEADVLLSSKNGTPTSLAIDTKFVYVTDQTDGHEAVTRIPKAGGAPTVYPSLPGCADIVVDTSAMYVAFTGESGPVSKGGIQKIPLQ